ncbi:MAG: ATP-binding protein [Clostridium fessum]
MPSARERWLNGRLVYHRNRNHRYRHRHFRGIPVAYFESFSRERSSTVSGIEGTGLGMGIVKNLVDLMHGTIEVKSKLGEGSTFTVRIPCRISSREETEPTAFDETAAQTLSGCRILLAEDNDLNAEISIELLTREGLLVERANDGVACSKCCKKRRKIIMI